MEKFSMRYEEAYGTGLGILFTMGINVAMKRPMGSRLYLFALNGGLGYAAGSWIGDFSTKRIHRREVYLQDYISQHPEDFPDQVPQKFKDVLEPWHPCR